MTYNSKPSLAVLLVFFAALMAALLLLPALPADTGRLWGEIWNLGHIAAFAVLTILVLRRLSVTTNLLLPAGILVLFAMATEVLQMVTGREASVQDLLFDIAGILLGYSYHLKNRGLQFAAAAGLVLALGPLLMVIIDESRARQDFPVLGEFESRHELSRWNGNADRELDHSHTKNGAGALRVTYLPGTPYSDLTLRHFPGDWRHYRWLRFEVFYPGQRTLNMYFRIHDQQHEQKGWEYADRYNSELSLKPGWNTIQVDLDKVRQAPAGRTMDMSRIAHLSLFTGRVESPFTLYIDSVRLIATGPAPIGQGK